MVLILYLFICSNYLLVGILVTVVQTGNMYAPVQYLRCRHIS